MTDLKHKDVIVMRLPEKSLYVLNCLKIVGFSTFIMEHVTFPP